MELFETSKDDIIIPKKFVHNELNPYLWDKENGEYILKPEVLKKLKEISQYFFEFLEIKNKYEDVYFLGSMASYNWTSKSDIDLHLIFDYSKINNNVSIVKMFMDMKKAYWNSTHDIKIFNYQVELYCQDINEKNAAKAIYSIENDKWILKPDLENFTVDKENLRSKIINFVNKIEDLEKIKNNQAIIDSAVKIKEKIKTMRKSGLEKQGEFSVENLTFKYLRNNGYLEKLNNIKRDAVDKKLSLNE